LPNSIHNFSEESNFNVIALRTYILSINRVPALWRETRIHVRKKQKVKFYSTANSRLHVCRVRESFYIDMSTAAHYKNQWRE